ncbi:hypothetical protein MBLNU457_3393t1 [Dothideomycetes sp. NU457]
MQTSIATWLSKPTSVVKPPTAPIAEPEQRAARSPSQSEDAHRQNRQGTEGLKTALPPDIVERQQATSEKSLPSLHPQVTLEPLSKTNLPGFKRVNSTLLPIPYTRKFYDEIFTDPVAASITLIAIWNDNTSEKSSQEDRKVIGGIRCRILHDPSANGSKIGKPMLYISTLTLLSPYRHLGIAAHLLARVEKVAKEKYRVGAIGAHVWVANTEGLEWYRKRGFEEVKMEEGYYSRLKPTAAVVVRKDTG